ncbi:hypothetical protein F2Q68_00037814 [Brassica cretica]|uniref:Sof1-like protein domain-containing protein n=1 Tax=Brassica cretica TaxID=69181 RepID=A0A8S9H644_BRACR|nr:hypothetical protein F2Q68_00037814 [Brassica cretica]
MRSMLLAIQSADITTLINPGPVTEHESTISEVGSVLAISSPRAFASFGFFLVEHMRIAMLLQNKQTNKEARTQHRHLPKPIYKAKTESRAMDNAKRRKDDRRKAHSAPGTVVTESHRTRRIIKEAKWI